MKNLNKPISVICTLALLIFTSTLHAGDHSSPGSVQAGNSGSSKMNDLQSSVFLTSIISAAILVMPFVFSKEMIDDSAKSSAESKTQHCEKPCCGQSLPEMEVQHIGYDDKGQRQVVFAVADHPQQSLMLLWLLPDVDKDKTLPDPAADFAIGQKVQFQPSTQFSGCLLQDTSGQTLAFVPAGHAVPSYSEDF